MRSRTALLWLLTRAVLLATVWLFDADDDITELAWTWAADLLDGRSPYHDVAVAYPPLAMFGFALPGMVAGGPGSYALPFALMMLAVDGIGARLGGLRYVIAVPAIGPVLLLWRYDLAPAVCHLGACAAALAGRRDRSWVWLGAGIALKPYLVVAVPLWLLWDPRRRGLILALVPSALAALVMTLLIGTGWVDSYVFQGTRELSVEAGPAVVASLLGVGAVELDRACLCFVRAGAGAAGAVGSLLTIGLLLATYLRFRRADAEGLVRGSIVAVAVLLLAAPVFSPQYLVWLLPAAALIGGVSLWLAAAAAFTGFLAYPLLYDAVLSDDALPLLLARLLLLIALIVGTKPAPRGRIPASPGLGGA